MKVVVKIKGALAEMTAEQSVSDLQAGLCVAGWLYDQFSIDTMNRFGVDARVYIDNVPSVANRIIMGLE